MIDSLNDPKVIIGILAIINSIVLTLVFQWWRQRKSLSCEIVSNIPLLNVRHEIKHRVQVLLDSKPVENVHLVVSTIVNTGRVHIDDKDFTTPISVSFGDNSEILTAEITKTSPSDLPAKIIVEKQSVTVEPLMLNRGDAITIRILVSKPSNPIRVAGRVKGIPQLKKHDAPKDSGKGAGGCLRFLYVWVMVIATLAAPLLAAGILEIDPLERLGILRYILYTILMLLSFIVPAYYFQKAGEKFLER